MAARSLRAAVLGLALVLAGCAAEPAPPTVSPQPGSQQGLSSDGPSVDETPPAPLPLSPDVLQATECVESGASAPGVAGSFGEAPPPGWEPPLGSPPATFVTAWVFECARVSWGNLERPSFILWEVHESFDVPATCREEGTLNYVVGTAWFSDPGLLEVALGLGLPGQLGAFDRAEEDVQGMRTWTWRWNAPGQDGSTLRVSDQPPDVGISRISPARFFWFHEGGVAYFANEFVEESNQAGNPTAFGTMAAPMLYARAGQPAFVGTGSLIHTSHFSGTIHHFEDLACTQPLAS